MADLYIIQEVTLCQYYCLIFVCVQGRAETRLVKGERKAEIRRKTNSLESNQSLHSSPEKHNKNIIVIMGNRLYLDCSETKVFNKKAGMQNKT